jgi:putative ABC transport system permease protein
MPHTLRTIRIKTIRDLWRHRSRTLMVVLSIAIGVLGIGMIATTWDILRRDLGRRYAAVVPAHVEIYVPAGVTVDDLRGLQTAAGVAQVQGRAAFSGRYRSSRTGRWEPLDLIAVPDPAGQSVNILPLQAGVWPGRDQIALERSALGEMRADIGQALEVEDALGRSRTLQVSGVIHQQDDLSTMIRGSPVALVSLDAMTRLVGHDRVNTIYVTAADLARQAEAAEAVRNQLERAGYAVGRVTLRDPFEHPAEDVLGVLMLVMGILAALALVLSSLLVTNTISALIAQQIDQIGAMKAIGASTGIVMRVYSLTVLAYGLLGTAVAAPLAERLGYWLASYLAAQINVDLYPFRRSFLALGVMLAVGIIVPFIAAAKPLWDGAAITVRQAISDYGLGGGSGENRLTRCLERVRGLPRLWSLALRNAVRVPHRLLLTLLTLALAGATFIAVLSTDRSFDRSIANLLEGQHGMDALLSFKGTQRVSQIVPIVASHTDVIHAEAWHFGGGVMKLPSGQERQATIFAGPINTRFYQPELESGRWLAPDDSNAAVVNRKWADEEGLRLGDVITLDLGGGAPQTEWVVVGFNRDLVRRQTGVFLSLESLDRVLKRSDRTVTLQVQYAAHDLAYQRRVSDELADLLAGHGIEVFSTLTMGQIRSQVVSLYRILVVFLLVMSALTALVGGLGLMGMMSINVLERRKEIGVMRAIGAEARAIIQVFWGESLLITLASFPLAVALSAPMSRIMARAVGLAFINTPLDFAYATAGIAYWLALLLLIGTAASVAPALSAANLRVRESLSYE